MNKKDIRKKFRDQCLIRDKYKCVMCAFQSTPNKAEQELDVHHIQNRKEIVNGGYCAPNGISLCFPCHQKAEQFHSTGTAYPGYSIEELYKVINSSLKQAIEASQKLK